MSQASKMSKELRKVKRKIKLIQTLLGIVISNLP